MELSGLEAIKQRYATADDAAAYLDLNKESVRRLVRQGDFPNAIRWNNKVLIPWGEVRAYIPRSTWSLPAFRKSRKTRRSPFTFRPRQKGIKALVVVDRPETAGWPECACRFAPLVTGACVRCGHMGVAGDGCPHCQGKHRIMTTQEIMEWRNGRRITSMDNQQGALVFVRHANAILERVFHMMARQRVGGLEETTPTKELVRKREKKTKPAARKAPTCDCPPPAGRVDCICTICGHLGLTKETCPHCSRSGVLDGGRPYRIPIFLRGRRELVNQREGLKRAAETAAVATINGWIAKLDGQSETTAGVP